jgi:hypothetical protein
MGKCEYIFTKDFGREHAFEVLQQNEVCDWDGRVSCTKSIRVIFQNIEVIMERGGLVHVDGVRANLPWKKSGSSLISIVKLVSTIDSLMLLFN